MWVEEGMVAVARGEAAMAAVGLGTARLVAASSAMARRVEGGVAGAGSVAQTRADQARAEATLGKVMVGKEEALQVMAGAA